MTDAAARLDAPSLETWEDAPSWNGLRTAAIGRLDGTDPDALAARIEAECDRLRAAGFEAVIGPMEGDTWHAYRYAVESDGSAYFLMEPPSAPFALEALGRAGFDTIETYSSSRSTLVAIPEPARLDGVTVAPWDGSDPERFLADVYALSCEAFAKNPFYKPLDRAGFDRIYRPLVPMLDRRLVRFAHDAEGGLLGFVFGFPQLRAPGTCVLKTYASRRRGVGRVLLDAFHAAAGEAGFDTVIHALMHDGNESLDRSGRHGGTRFRRYALLGRRL